VDDAYITIAHGGQ